ncbi:MAG: sigma-70 family RNA polymerase sigma factor [Elusimicrobiota bacterium]|nr:sigma-70 family RNA polymerase sigma factor [Elusimicrobiota bacterium]
MSEQEFLAGNAELVFNLALRLTGNKADAEDLAQDALIRALKALPRFRGESKASTWVYRITVNAWKNRVRSEKRRAFWKTVTLGFYGKDEDGEDEVRDVKADEPALDAELEKTEKSGQVQTALLQLEEDDRAIVVLREIEERSYEEIGEMLDLPQGTVKSRLFRARAKLKELLKPVVRAS